MNDSKEINLDKLEYSFVDKLPSGVRQYVIYPIQDFYSKYSERISRSYAFAKIGWKNYDFDSVFIYELMSFKLKRIKRCLIEGYGVQEEVDIKALQEAIEICDRLFLQDYESKYHKLHDKKWGDLPRFTAVKCEDSKHHRVLFKDRPNVVDEITRELERIEFLAVYDKAEIDRRIDLDRLTVILKEHLPKWWD